MAILLMRLLAKAIEKSRNTGKGFLGAGILLLIYGIFSVIVCLIGKTPFLDLSMVMMGFWYIGYGKISEDEYKSSTIQTDNEEITTPPTNGVSNFNSNITGYANYIRENCDFCKLPQEEVEDFVQNVIIPSEKVTEAVTLEKFNEFKERLYAQNREEGFITE